jgi:cytochrome P450
MERADAHELFNFCDGHFGPAVREWASTVMPGRNAEPSTIAEQEHRIDETFTKIEARLADGRRFLMGNAFTAPDLAFAALAGPVLMPHQYAGKLLPVDRLPQAAQSAVERWRARPAGQFALRLYEQERGRPAPDLIALGKHAAGDTFLDKLANFLVRPALLRYVFGFLRRFSPILILGKRAIVTRYDDVVEVLKRDKDFSISQINAPKIDQIDGPFILGMDDSPQYELEKRTLHEAARMEDLDRIRQFVARSAAELIEAARPRQRIDVVHGLARVVPLRLVASYCGMPGPDEPTMMRWMRDIFHYLFADLTNSKSVESDALNSARELRSHMDAQIALRRSERDPSRPVDDMLGRLLAMQDDAHPWLDDHAVRRNLAGVIVGAVDTTSKFVTLAIDELLRRPQQLAEARKAALAGNIETVRRYAWEAVRFNPHHPLQVRYCARGTQVAAGQPRSKTIPAGASVYTASLAGMFDPAVFVNPDKFDATREVEYLHFGYGLHTCFGRAINGVQIPELLAALLRLPNLRRASGDAGRIAYDGPFPDRLVLEFDA